jgi:hypothetical protein
MNKAITVSLVLYLCDIWSPILKGGTRVRVSGNKVLAIFGPRREEVKGPINNYIMRCFIIFSIHQELVIK